MQLSSAVQTQVKDSKIFIQQQADAGTPVPAPWGSYPYDSYELPLAAALRSQHANITGVSSQLGSSRTDELPATVVLDNIAYTASANESSAAAAQAVRSMVQHAVSLMGPEQQAPDVPLNGIHSHERPLGKQKTTVFKSKLVFSSGEAALQFMAKCPQTLRLPIWDESGLRHDSGLPLIKWGARVIRDQLRTTQYTAKLRISVEDTEAPGAASRSPAAVKAALATSLKHTYGDMVGELIRTGTEYQGKKIPGDPAAAETFSVDSAPRSDAEELLCSLALEDPIMRLLEVVSVYRAKGSHDSYMVEFADSMAALLVAEMEELHFSDGRGRTIKISAREHRAALMQCGVLKHALLTRDVQHTLLTPTALLEALATLDLRARDGVIEQVKLMGEQAPAAADLPELYLRSLDTGATYGVSELDERTVMEVVGTSQGLPLSKMTQTELAIYSRGFYGCELTFAFADARSAAAVQLSTLALAPGTGKMEWDPVRLGGAARLTWMGHPHSLTKRFDPICSDVPGTEVIAKLVVPAVAIAAGRPIREVEDSAKAETQEWVDLLMTYKEVLTSNARPTDLKGKQAISPSKAMGDMFARVAAAGGKQGAAAEHGGATGAGNDGQPGGADAQGGGAQGGVDAQGDADPPAPFAPGAAPAAAPAPKHVSDTDPTRRSLFGSLGLNALAAVVGGNRLGTKRSRAQEEGEEEDDEGRHPLHKESRFTMGKGHNTDRGQHGTILRTKHWKHFMPENRVTRDWHHKTQSCTCTQGDTLDTSCSFGTHAPTTYLSHTRWQGSTHIAMMPATHTSSAHPTTCPTRDATGPKLINATTTTTHQRWTRGTPTGAIEAAVKLRPILMLFEGTVQPMQRLLTRIQTFTPLMPVLLMMVQLLALLLLSPLKPLLPLPLLLLSLRLLPSPLLLLLPLIILPPVLLLPRLLWRPMVSPLPLPMKTRIWLVLCMQVPPQLLLVLAARLRSLARPLPLLLPIPHVRRTLMTGVLMITGMQPPLQRQLPQLIAPRAPPMHISMTVLGMAVLGPMHASGQLLMPPPPKLLQLPTMAHLNFNAHTAEGLNTTLLAPAALSRDGNNNSPLKVSCTAGGSFESQSRHSPAAPSRETWEVFQPVLIETATNTLKYPIALPPCNNTSPNAKIASRHLPPAVAAAIEQTSATTLAVGALTKPLMPGLMLAWLSTGVIATIAATVYQLKRAVERSSGKAANETPKGLKLKPQDLSPAGQIKRRPKQHMTPRVRWAKCLYRRKIWQAHGKQIEAAKRKLCRSKGTILATAARAADNADHLKHPPRASSPALYRQLYLMALRARSNCPPQEDCQEPPSPQRITSLHPRSGGSAQITEMAPTRIPPGLYWEKQLNQNCYLHSLNMLLGKKTLEPRVVETCLAEEVESATHPQGLRAAYTAGGGPYSQLAINRFLFRHSQDPIYLHTCSFQVPGEHRLKTWITGLSKEQILAQLPIGCTGFLLSHTARGMGHMKCIKFNSTDGKWYSLDSWVSPFVYELQDTADWHSMAGSIQVLVKGDPYSLNMLMHPPPLPLREASPPQLHLNLHTSEITLSTTPVRYLEELPYEMVNEVIDLAMQPPTFPPPTQTGPGRDPPSPKGDTAAQVGPKAPAPRVPPIPPRNSREGTNKRRNKRGQTDIRAWLQARPLHPKPKKDRHGKNRRMRTTGPANNATHQRHSNQGSASGQEPKRNGANTPKAHSTPAQQPPTCRELLKVAILNARGLTTILEDIRGLCTGAQRPHVLVIAESKLLKKRCQQINQLLPKEYKVVHSCIPKGNAPQAGVSIMYLKELADLGVTQEFRPPEHLEGYLNHIELLLPMSKPLHVVGVYCPSGGPGDIYIRRQIYQSIEQHLAKHQHQDSTTLILGDFNATLANMDRATGRATAVDKEHRAFVQRTSLHPTEPIQTNEARQYTYFASTYRTPTSRLDDILTNLPPLTTTDDKWETSAIDTSGWNTDHNGLMLSAPYGTLQMAPPPPEDDKSVTKGTTKLRLPMSQADKTALSSALADELGTELTALDTEIQGLLDQEVNMHWRELTKLQATECHTLKQLQAQPARQVIDELGRRLVDILVAAQDIAMRVCRTKHIAPQGFQCRPRTVSRKRHKLMAVKKAAVTWLRAQTPEQEEETLATNPSLANLIQTSRGENTQATKLEVAKRILQDTKHAIATLDRQYQTHAVQAHARRIQELTDTNQKVGNQLATGRLQGKNKWALKVLKTMDGSITTDGSKIRETIEQYLQQRLRAVGAAKTGKYLPSVIPDRRYPWNQAQANDKFQLETPALSNRHWLSHILRDECTFRECMKSLAHNKAPGPDGVINEVLQALPMEGKRCMHGLIQIMWATGLTPNSWKNSRTILLFKNKGTPLELKYYRRVGLENTAYKLWTRMVTYALADFAERNGVLSSSQAGFRNKRMTAHQLETMVMMLEDAKIWRQNLYLLQIDFTEAFDTIDHDKLLQIMYDLGFPTDGIEVVKDLYDGATTMCSTPTGDTAPLQIDRGTIQGDSLSPFLFILYLEPLLRWLRVGSRGYKFRSIDDPALREKYQCSDCTYADDLNAITHTVSDLQVQAQKITEYADWAHLLVNNTKSTATGALHRHQPQHPIDSRTIHTHLEGMITIQGKPISIHDPGKPFRFLGVNLTLSLSWKPQLKELLDKIRDQLWHLKISKGSSTQKLRILRTCVRPAITYSFPLAPYAAPELQLLDSLLTRAVKHAYGMRTGMPTATVHQDVDKGGLGFPSLQVDYHTIAAQRLVRALNDGGQLGAISRAMLEKQVQGLDALTAQEVTASTAYALRVRQLAAMHRCGLKLEKQGVEYGNLPALPQLLAKLSTAEDYPEHIAADLFTLQKLELSQIGQIIDSTSNHVIPASALKNMCRGVKTKHLRALNRVTRYLHQGPYAAQVARPVQATDLSWDERAIHPQFSRNIKDHCHLKKSPIIMLLEASNNPNAASAMSDKLILDLTCKGRRKRKASSIRHTAEGSLPPPAARRGQGSAHLLKPTGYSRFTTLPSRCSATMMERRLKLYNCWSMGVNRISAVKFMQTESEHKGKGKARRTVQSQRQYMVSWEPTILQGWTVTLAEQLGYKIKERSTAHASDIDKEQHAVCEYCAHQPCMQYQELVQCQTCQRHYHTECMLPTERDRWTITNSAGTNWSCDECERHGWTTTTLPPELQLQRVTWADSAEPEDWLLANCPLDTIAVVKELRNAAWEQEKQPPRQEGLSNLQRQGCYNPDDGRVYDVTVGQLIRQKLIVQPTAINPHRDIHGTGSYEVSIREVMMRHNARTYTQTLACIYSPDGSCKFTLSPERLALLWAWFNESKTQNPGLHRRLQAGDFEQEVYHLMTRYHQSTLKGSEQSICIPSNIVDAVHKHIDLRKDRDTHPTAVHPSTRQYWSGHKRDRLFGANWESSRCRWTGSSICCPGLRQENANKAVTWALRCASHTQVPTLTVLMIPDSTDVEATAYTRALALHPRLCRRLIRIPASDMRYDRPYHWEKPGGHDMYKKQSMNIVAIGNAQGFDTYMPNWDQERLTAMASDIAATLSANKQSQVTAESIIASEILASPIQALEVAVPKWMAKLPADTDLKGTRLLQPLLPDPQGVSHQYSKQPPLRYDWAELAYTDGSVVAGTSNTPGGAGAGVYVPPQGIAEEKRIPVEPGCTLSDNTINRAELAAIHTAVSHGCTNIATDSLSSIYQIQRYALRPQDMQEHRHQRLIGSIIEIIKSSQHPIHIYKVKSHIGIVGNEIADEIAVSVAKGRLDGGQPMECSIPSNRRESMFWPKFRTNPCQPRGAADAGRPGKPLEDIGSSLKKLCHTLHKMGRANINSVYYSSLQQILPDLDNKHSHKFITSSKITFGERRYALQYRTGGLYTAKLAYRYGHQPTSACPLCGQPDGGHHAVSACPGVNKAVTKRHNAAGQIIAKAVRQGNLGAHVTMMDVGSKQTAQEHDLQTERRIPREALPWTMPERLKHRISKGMVPDILLYKPAAQGAPAQYWIVEIKYCRDTNPSEQEGRATAQHRRLQRILQRYDNTANVQIIPIMLGVSGSIYITTKQALATLGVEEPALGQALKKLHLHAVKSLAAIMKLRRHKEGFKRVKKRTKKPP